MGIGSYFTKQFEGKNAFEKVMTALGAVCILAAVVLAFVQLFGAWDYAFGVAELLVITAFIAKGISCFRAERNASFVYFGGAVGMVILFLLDVLR